MTSAGRAHAADRFTARVAAADWNAGIEEINDYGCALLPRLLTPDESAELAALYDEPNRFRSTVNMQRHRFGQGEYRYFAEPFPRRSTGCGERCIRDCCRSPGIGTPSSAGIRHGVSAIRSGRRHTLGLVFHDAT